MSQLEVKEKELNKLKQECDQLVVNQHPASDKIEVYLKLPTFLLCSFFWRVRYKGSTEVKGIASQILNLDIFS